MKVYAMGKVPVMSWCNDPEKGALEQAEHLSNLPFIYKHICLMPDTHLGYGMPIGGVIACDDVVIPNAVGVDIGCGMCAVRMDIPGISHQDLVRVVGRIRAEIPTGFKHHKHTQEWHGFSDAPDIDVINRELSSARHQLGTLGGGNHFIEIQKGSDDHIWMMVHSGSRNFGLKIANEYHRKAVDRCRRKGCEPPHKDLSFLPAGSKTGIEYIAAMQFALRFAKENRLQMMNRIVEAMVHVTGAHPENQLDIHHNYANLENHYHRDVWVHRKGAVKAARGLQGIIPGSQGTWSYITEGLGNRESFESCAHGAGRRMGRKQAIRTLVLQEEVRRMDEQGILHGMHRSEDLDEAAGAYKDIDIVMEEQKDLVKILVRLQPLAVIKG